MRLYALGRPRREPGEFPAFAYTRFHTRQPLPFPQRRLRRRWGKAWREALFVARSRTIPRLTPGAFVCSQVCANDFGASMGCLNNMLRFYSNLALTTSPYS